MELHVYLLIQDDIVQMGMTKCSAPIMQNFSLLLFRMFMYGAQQRKLQRKTNE